MNKYPSKVKYMYFTFLSVYSFLSPCTCLGQQQPTDWSGAAVSPVRGAQEEGVSGARDAANRLQGLQRENGRLQEQLRSSEELNASLRSELDLHCSIMAQSGSRHLEHNPSHDHKGSGLQTKAHKRDRDTISQQKTAEQPQTVNSGRKLVIPYY